MLIVNNNSITIKTKHLNKEMLRNKFDTYFLYRESEIHKNVDSFLDSINIRDYSKRCIVKKCINKYQHCIKLDIMRNYDDRIDTTLIVKYLREVQRNLVDLGFDCDKRYQVYEFINQYHANYYKHNIKKTMLFFGGMITHMK